MKARLKVIKTDGSIEEYLHTKVIGTVSNALAQTGQPDMYIAEQFADVVTYYLYHSRSHSAVTTCEIFSIIKAVLTSAGYEQAAIALNEYQLERKLRRCRVEVISADIQELADAELLSKVEQVNGKGRWDKSIIVNNLVTKHGISRQTARAIAAMVEERIFKMGLTLATTSLIKQLVLGEAAVVLRAERQLQTV
jgi:hypothetical protein